MTIKTSSGVATTDGSVPPTFDYTGPQCIRTEVDNYGVGNDGDDCSDDDYSWNGDDDNDESCRTRT